MVPIQRDHSLASLRWLVAALALELGRRLTWFHHHRAGLAAATALSHEFGRQLHNGSGSRCHGLIALGPEFGLCQRWSATPHFHKRATIPAGRWRCAVARPPGFASFRSAILASSLRFTMAIIAVRAAIASIPSRPHFQCKATPNNNCAKFVVCAVCTRPAHRMG
jgi:hypothetical protein